MEHQSRPDKMIAFRILRDANVAIQQHLDAGHSQQLLVTPLLFYHCIESPYPYSLNWLALFQDANMDKSIYAQVIPLVDLTFICDDDIM
ncbi:Rpn family recombination-promoting nuclease/putative transposase [Vibrio parahaemolyticus]|nr:Rpn family recombination-promoting nuclease/putative transposase [Vibrio parahaemolyticus]ELA7258654.1 Rpn family recombination-promoting nuclease/putative transposase [Vibrio parahaemolyticus]EMF1842314.1 Rpn family recombination-promoting nuclease/putative transposase [Vibrio parahaemolyticus]